MRQTTLLQRRVSKTYECTRLRSPQQRRLQVTAALTAMCLVLAFAMGASSPVPMASSYLAASASSR